MYAFFTAVVVRETKPSLETGINGAWLLAIVSTQSVSVLGTLLAPGDGERPRGSAVLRAVHVPAGGHALPHDHHAHLLSLHLRGADGRADDATVLDQHGRRRHHHAGRVVAPAPVGSLVIPDDAPAVHRGLHAVLLGLCHVVDSVAGHPGRVEARRPAFSLCGTTLSIGAWCFRWACTRSAP